MKAKAQSHISWCSKFLSPKSYRYLRKGVSLVPFRHSAKFRGQFLITTFGRKTALRCYHHHQLTIWKWITSRFSGNHECLKSIIRSPWIPPNCSSLVPDSFAAKSHFSQDPTAHRIVKHIVGNTLSLHFDAGTLNGTWTHHGSRSGRS